MKNLKSYFLFLLIGFVHFAQSQDLITNFGQVVSIDAGTTMTILGNATNDGLWINEGEVRLSGDWTNTDEYRSVSGTFHLIGVLQTIESGGSSFAVLAVDGGGNKMVLSDLRINTSLDLISGILTVPDQDSLLVRETAIINGGDTNAYVSGTLYQTPQGDAFYPIGSASEYLPVDLVNVQTSSPVGVKGVSAASSLDVTKGLEILSPNRYWELVGSSFSADGISLPVVNENFITDTEDAAIALSVDPFEVARILGVAVLNGSLSSGTISTTGNISSGIYLLAEKSVAKPSIKVINVVTGLQDGKHDFLRIENIEFYESNRVEIFDRQGTKVFEMSNYNNIDRVFRGRGNIRNTDLLITGSYYYSVKLGSKKSEAGFIYVKN